MQHLGILRMYMGNVALWANIAYMPDVKKLPYYVGQSCLLGTTNISSTPPTTRSTAGEVSLGYYHS